MKLSICLTVALTALFVAAAPAQHKTFTPLRDLAVGNIIYAKVVIDTADFADPNSKSTTAKKIKKGEPVPRLAVVLVPGSTSVQVAYLATFKKSTKLPASFADKSMWYPIRPATKESIYDPLPAVNNNAQWACLRRRQTITANRVEKVADSLSEASANLILHAMHA